MTVPGCDYAFSHPNPAGLYAAGMRFAMRYVGPGTADKHLTAAERDQLWAAGLSIVLLAEGAVDDPQGGSSVGVTHAKLARAQADTLGAPKGLPIYFAVDRDENSGNWAAAEQYLAGCDSVLGEGNVGVYGEHDVMVWAARDTVAAWYFQTYAWSGGQWFPGNHVEQYQNDVNMAGGVVDLCRAKTTDYGQWAQGGDVSTEDVIIGTSQLYDQGANRNTPTGRNFARDFDAMVSAAMADEMATITAALADIKAAIAAIGGGGVTVAQVDARIAASTIAPPAQP